MIYKVEHTLNIIGEHSWDVSQYKLPMNEDTCINKPRRSSFGIEVIVDSETIGIQKGDNEIVKVLDHGQKLMVRDFAARLRLLYGDKLPFGTVSDVKTNW